jgi:hypothetical protein
MHVAAWLIGDEVFAVQVLPGRQYPKLVNDDAKLVENSFVVPDVALVDAPAAMRCEASREDPWRFDEDGSFVGWALSTDLGR